MGHEILPLLPFMIDKLAIMEMDEDNEIHSCLTNGGRSHFDMDEAFCTRMRAVIAAGLESAPLGVVTTPGTKNPKYIPATPAPLPSSQRAMEHA